MATNSNTDINELFRKAEENDTQALMLLEEIAFKDDPEACFKLGM